jgi:GNAT superfamily N-acetyltransferase
MPALQLHALSDDLRGACAGLLAERYARQRRREPLLPEVADLEPHVPHGPGVVATRGDRAVAYLAGDIDDDTARVGFAGVAASEPEALRDCFAELADRWSTHRFAVAVPAGDGQLADAFFHLAFGCQFVWAVRDTEPPAPVDFGGTIRPGTPDDLTAVAELDLTLWQLQAGSPSFSGLDVPSLEEFRTEWSDLWNDPDFTHVVAERDGKAVGHVVLYRRPGGDLRVPPANTDLAHAATLDEVRGTGVGLALTAHVLRLARDRGDVSMTTDWRAVNLLSSRFWPRRGFRPQYLRLYRAVP